MPSAFVVLADDAGPCAGCVVPRVQQGGREEGRAVRLPPCPSLRITQVSGCTEPGHRRGAEAGARPRSRTLRAHGALSARGPLLVPLPSAVVGVTVWLLSPRGFRSLPEADPCGRAPWPVLGCGHPPHPYIQVVPSRRQYFIAGGKGN